MTYCGCISRDHPALIGHFPGNPIVPGVLLLTELLRAIEKGFGLSIRVLELPSVKFTAPLRPGEHFTIILDPLDDRQLKFTATRDRTAIASGIIRYTGEWAQQASP